MLPEAIQARRRGTPAPCFRLTVAGPAVRASRPSQIESPFPFHDLQLVPTAGWPNLCTLLAEQTLRHPAVSATRCENCLPLLPLRTPSRRSRPCLPGTRGPDG